MEGINEYILDRAIADLPEGSVQEFWSFWYETFEQEYGIVRSFPGEVFYRATNNNFLGRECIHALIAALDGKIYKVLFRFITPSTPEYDSFREDALAYLLDKFGNPSEARKLSEVPHHAIGIWDGNFGNVILDSDMLGTTVIFTSSALRPKKKSSLGSSSGGPTTKKQTAGERAVAFLNIARGVKYGAATCTMKAGDIYLDPAPRTYDAAQRAAGADAEAAARVARHPSVIGANAVAAHCFAALDATFLAGATAGLFGTWRATKATMRAIEAHDAAIEGLRAALDNAYAEDAAFRK